MAEPNAAAEPSSESYAAEHATAYKVKGNGLFKEGDFAGAVAAYSEAIALDPGNGVLYSNRSGAYLALGGAVSKAFKDAEECVRLRPDWPKAYGRRGAAEAALTRFVAAQSSYRRALDLDPAHGLSLQNRRDLTGFLSRTSEGQRIMQAALWRARSSDLDFC